MTNEQMYLAIGLGVVLNLLFNGFMVLALNSRMNERFNAIDKRFDDMRDLWRAELHRVEEVLDARLRHLEQR
jgi:hypothetical protein